MNQDQNDDFWPKQFAQLETMTRTELVNLQKQVNTALEKLNLGASNKDFLVVFKQTIDMATQMNQLYGVLRFTGRWDNGNRGTAKRDSKDN